MRNVLSRIFAVIPVVIYFICLVAVSVPVAIAQKNDSGFIENPRPKVLRLEYRSVTEFTLNSQSALFGNSVADLKVNERKRIKLDLPVLLKPKDQLAIGLRVYKEEFEFVDIQQSEYPLYQNLEDKALWTLGLRGTYRRKMNAGRYFAVRVGANLNGDGINLQQFGDYLKGEVLFVLGNKKNSRTEIGYGLGASYDLGAPLAYPVFLYKKNMGRHWRLNLQLPKKAEMQYAFSPKMYAFFTAEISGASYHLSREVLPGFSNVELRYSELRSSLRIEREVYDWLWVSGEFGFLQNLNLYLTEPNKRRVDNLVSSDPFSATYLHFTLFIVPPRKMMDRL